jgi:hypothetical protein
MPPPAGRPLTVAVEPDGHVAVKLALGAGAGAPAADSPASHAPDRHRTYADVIRNADQGGLPSPSSAPGTAAPAPAAPVAAPVAAAVAATAAAPAAEAAAALPSEQLWGSVRRAGGAPRGRRPASPQQARRASPARAPRRRRHSSPARGDAEPAAHAAGGEASHPHDEHHHHHLRAEAPEFIPMSKRGAAAQVGRVARPARGGGARRRAGRARFVPAKGPHSSTSVTAAGAHARRRARRAGDLGLRRRRRRGTQRARPRRGGAV